VGQVGSESSAVGTSGLVLGGLGEVGSEVAKIQGTELGPGHPVTVAKGMGSVISFARPGVDSVKGSIDAYHGNLSNAEYQGR